MRYDLTKALPSASVRRLNPGLFDHSGVGTYLQQEKQQDVDAGKTHHKTRIPAANKEDNSQFRISIAFRYSSYRRRDLDGGTATILDALVAVRRLLVDSSRSVSDWGEVQSRR